MVLGHRGIEPESVAHHISIGDGLQGLRSAHQNIATNHHGVDALRSHLHHLLVEGQLQTEQILRKTLTTLPTEHRYRGEYLARRGVRWQATTLSASVQKYALFAWQPLAERLAILNCHTGLKQPSGASATTQLMTNRVVGTEVLLATESCYIVKTIHQVWWEGKEFLH